MTIEGEDKVEIGQRMREYVDALGMDYNDFADKAGVNRTQFTNAMVGKQSPSADMIYKIGSAYRISIDWVLFGEGAMERIDAESPLRNADPKTIANILWLLKSPDKVKYMHKILTGLIESATTDTPENP